MGSTSLYDEIILSIASAELMSKFLAVVKALVLSLTPPSGSSSTFVPRNIIIMKHVVVKKLRDFKLRPSNLNINLFLTLIKGLKKLNTFEM